jgi:hypothetical protein
MTILDSLPLWLLGGLLLGACILFALAVSHAAHGFGWTLDREDLDSATVLHALVSLVYSVALALIVINAQEDHTEVRKATVLEASALSDLYRGVEALDAADRDAIRGLVSGYLDVVIDAEWPALKAGGAEPRAARAFEAVSHRVLALRPQDSGALVVQRALIDDVDAAADARRDRIFLGGEGVNAPTWAVVILGAMVALGFAGLFPVRARQRRVVIAFTASMFGLMLFLLAATSPPLRGQMGVQPKALEDLRAEIRSAAP